jgi:DNA-binding transcriptional LysR family regulator
VDAIEGIRRLLLRGIGTAVLPVSTFCEDIRAGRIAAYPIADANVHRILALAHQAGQRLPVALEEVSQIVVAEMNALLDQGVFGVPRETIPSPRRQREGRHAADVVRKQRSTR